MTSRRMFFVALFGLLAPAWSNADIVYNVDFKQSVDSRPGGYLAVHGTITLQDPSIRDPRGFSLIFSNDLGDSLRVFAWQNEPGNSYMNFLGTGYAADLNVLNVTSENPRSGLHNIGTLDQVNFAELIFRSNGTSFERRITFGGETSTVDLGTGNLYLLGAAAAVPEPGSLVLMGTGALGLAGYGWRRRRKS